MKTMSWWIGSLRLKVCARGGEKWGKVSEVYWHGEKWQNASSSIAVKNRKRLYSNSRQRRARLCIIVLCKRIQLSTTNPKNEQNETHRGLSMATQAAGHRIRHRHSHCSLATHPQGRLRSVRTSAVGVGRALVASTAGVVAAVLRRELDQWLRGDG